MGSFTFKPVSTYQTSAATYIEGPASTKEQSLYDSDMNTGIRKDGPTNLLDPSERYRLNTFWPTMGNARVSSVILSLTPAAAAPRTEAVWGDFIFRANPLPAYTEAGNTSEAILFGPSRAAVGASFVHDGNIKFISFNLSNSVFLYHRGGTVVGLKWEQIDWQTLQVEFSTQLDYGEAAQLRDLSLKITYNAIPFVTSVSIADLSGSTSFSSAPTVNWTYVDNDGDPQQQARVILVPPNAVDATGKLASQSGFDPLTTNSKLFDSDVVSQSTQSLRCRAGLSDGTTYYAFVRAYQAPVLGVAQYSTWTRSVLVTVSITPPNAPSVTVIPYNSIAGLAVDVILGDKQAFVVDGAAIDIERSTNGVDWIPARDGVNITSATGVRVGAPGTSTANWILTEAGDTLTTEASEELNLESSSAGNAITTPNSSALSAGTSSGFILTTCVSFETADMATLQPIIASKWLVAGGANQASWMVSVDATGHLQFQWTTNGNSGTTLHTVQGPILTVVALQPKWIRIIFSGTGTHQVLFYTSDDPYDTDPEKVVWSSATIFTGVGSTSIYQGTAPIALGAYNTGSDGNTPISFYVFGLYRTSTATVLANPDFRGVPLTSTSITDGIGNIWTIGQTTTNQAKLFVRIRDFEVLPDVYYFYRARVTGYDDSGDPLTTANISDSNSYTMSTSLPYWWLKAIYSPDLNVNRELHLGSWDGKRPVDAAAFSALGRENKIVVSDVVHGREQVLKVDCMTLAEYQALVALYKNQSPLFVHSYVESGYFKILDWDEDRGFLDGYNVVSLKVVEVDRPVVL